MPSPFEIVNVNPLSGFVNFALIAFGSADAKPNRFDDPAFVASLRKAQAERAATPAGERITGLGITLNERRALFGLEPIGEVSSDDFAQAAVVGSAATAADVGLSIGEAARFLLSPFGALPIGLLFPSRIRSDELISDEPLSGPGVEIFETPQPETRPTVKPTRPRPGRTRERRTRPPKIPPIPPIPIGPKLPPVREGAPLIGDFPDSPVPGRQVPRSPKIEPVGPPLPTKAPVGPQISPVVPARVKIPPRIKTPARVSRIVRTAVELGKAVLIGQGISSLIGQASRVGTAGPIVRPGLGTPLDTIQSPVATLTQARTKTREKRCVCDKKKPKKPRRKCWKGLYSERLKSTKFEEWARVDCITGKELSKRELELNP